MVLEQGKLLLGIPAVVYLTNLILRLPPRSFDRKRFAPLVSLVCAVGLSLLASTVEPSVNVWAAVVRGFVVAMAASGAWSVAKNYKEIGNNG